MASVAQIQANRSNAQKSTGPRTAAGKERASQNALKHGLLAREAVILGEDPEEFERYREGMLQELAPAGQVEIMLAERVVSLSWRLRRAEWLQNAAFAALEEGEPTDLLEARHEEWRQLKGSDWERGLAGVLDEDVLGQVVVEDFAGARVLDRLLMYERRIESSLYRTMAQLRRERQACTTGRESATPVKLASFSADAASGGIPCSKSGPPAGQEPVVAATLASFGADAVSEVQMRETAFGSPESLVGVARGTGILPVVGDRGQDAHAVETLDGITTNLAAAGNHGRDARATRTLPASPLTLHDRSCETNPISGGVSNWAHPGANEERVPDR